VTVFVEIVTVMRLRLQHGRINMYYVHVINTVQHTQYIKYRKQKEKKFRKCRLIPSAKLQAASKRMNGIGERTLKEVAAQNIIILTTLDESAIVQMK
jgi:hypothetical protein